MFIFTSSLLAVFLAGILQITPFAFWGNIKPNFLLVSILCLAGTLVKPWSERFPLVALGLAMAKFSSSFFSFETIALLFAALIGLLIIHYGPGNASVNILLGVALGTIAIYIMTFNFETLPIELIYNVGIASACLALFSFIPIHKND